MNVKLKYLLREKSGLFLYYRSIPADLRKHYGGKSFTKKSLKTHDAAVAAREAQRLAAIDDVVWQEFRTKEPKPSKAPQRATADFR
jgi:hypothetical protein